MARTKTGENGVALMERIQSDDVSSMLSFDGDEDDEDHGDGGKPDEIRHLKAEIIRLREEVARLQHDAALDSRRGRPRHRKDAHNVRRSRSLSSARMPKHEDKETRLVEMYSSSAGLHRRHYHHHQQRHHPKEREYVKLLKSSNDNSERVDGEELTFNDYDGVDLENPTNSDEELADELEIDLPYNGISLVFDRAGWLVGLLVLQSASSFIIKRNEMVLQDHDVIIQFLTMLVGAGGNAGNQATVKVIRGLAMGTIRTDTCRDFLVEELPIGLAISAILATAGCFRVAVFGTPFPETVAITVSLFTIVLISTVIGSLLPLGMKLVRIDPAHSSTTIQVIMDILGVTITVHVCAAILNSPFGLQNDG